MGLFGFGKKKAEDVLAKQFKDCNFNLEYKDGKYTYELVLPTEGYSLFPYFTLDEDSNDISIMINIRMADGGLTLLDYEKMNQFNLKSKYLVAKKNESNILYLEYNTKVSVSDVKSVILNINENVFSLAKEIDLL